MKNKFELKPHYRNISEYLLSQYRLSSSYGHRGSKGQIREDFLTSTLKEMAPDHVNLMKGEICDSNGCRSPEFDIIVYYLSNAIKLFSSDITNVLPVETVLSLIEVKSILSKDDIIKFNNDIKSINHFERYYIPMPIYKTLCDLKGTTEYTYIENRAIYPKEKAQGIGSVIGGIIAFETSKIETVKDWLKDLKGESNFCFILVLGHFFAKKDLDNKEWVFFEQGEDSFSCFACIFYETLTNINAREQLVLPDSTKYTDLLKQIIHKE